MLRRSVGLRGQRVHAEVPSQTVISDVGSAFASVAPTLSVDDASTVTDDPEQLFRLGVKLLIPEQPRKSDPKP